ncbi:MAG: tyrosine-type recombinase/integrase [Cyanobacteria bacterium P01_H01_bin.26]
MLQTSTANFKRGKNSQYRSREYLTADEMQRLMDSAENRGRYSIRDLTLLLLMYRHGLRASEAASLRWDTVLMDDSLLNIKRLKGSKSGVHPLKADELAALASLKVVAPGQYLFPSERGTHIISSRRESPQYEFLHSPEFTRLTAYFIWSYIVVIQSDLILRPMALLA